MQTDTSNILWEVLKEPCIAVKNAVTLPLTQILRRKTRWLAASCAAASAYLTGVRGRDEEEEKKEVLGGGEGKKPVAPSVCSSSLPLTLVLRLPIRADDEAGRDPSSRFLGFFSPRCDSPSRVQSRCNASAYEYVVSKSEKWRRDTQLLPAARRAV